MPTATYTVHRTVPLMLISYDLNKAGASGLATSWPRPPGSGVCGLDGSGGVVELEVGRRRVAGGSVQLGG